MTWDDPDSGHDVMMEDLAAEEAKAGSQRPCELCSAQPGEPCTGVNGIKLPYLHMVRTQRSQHEIKNHICPVCNAQPGQPCTQPTDQTRRPVMYFHTPRRDLAIRS